MDPGFLLEGPSRLADRAGIGPALAGTLWLVLLTAAVAFPIGIGTAIYLEEYAPRGRVTAAIGSALASLAGVPPVVYGVAWLALFVRGLGMGPSILAGGCTLAALALPTVIVTSRAAIQAVPDGMRLAAYSLGATRWHVIRGEVLPAAAPGILTGSCTNWPKRLSAGQRQRLCLARTLALRPEVLLMDEPTSALDPAATARIESLIHSLKRDYTIVLATHGRRQAARLSDLTAYLAGGELIEYGPTETLFTNPRDPRTESYLTGRIP